MRLKNSIILMMCVIVFSCGSKEFSSEEEMVAFISEEENNLQYKKNVNGVDYTLQYRPTDLMVKQELDNSKNPIDVKRLREKYSKQLYFNLSISRDDKELLSDVVNKEKFGEMVNELVFNMKQRVHLFSPKKDTLTMIDFIYPRMYGMSPSTTILIVYPRDQVFLKESFLNLTVEDIGLNTGEIKFKILTQPLKHEPKLNL